MISFTKKEIFELLKAWLILSVAFTILFANPFENGLFAEISIIFVISLFTAGLGFLLHELGHKLVAERFGCRTMFLADNKMLGLAVVLSFFGFIFAAPGAVYISGNINTEKNGKISMAGPLANLLLALAFLPGTFLLGGTLGAMANYGFSINAWIGLFNMIPAGIFDGAKIIKWSKPIYFVLVITLAALAAYSIFF